MVPLKKAFVLLLVSLLFHSGLHAQSKSDAKMALRLQKDITYLASDDLEGRLTGSAGEHKAADYIVKSYKDLPLKPYKTQYRYPFHFVYGKEVLPSTQVRVGNSVLNIPGDGFPLPFSASKKAYSELIPDVPEQGTVWMLNLYTDSEDASNPHFNAEKSIYDRAKEAETQGATGVLFYDGTGSAWPPTFNKLSEYEQVSIPVVFMGHDAYEKYVHNSDFLRKDKESIPVELNINIKKAERQGTNIAAYIDNKAANTVIIGAHYDHLGYGEDGNSFYKEKNRKIHYGADDNASGTAAILEIARYVKARKLRHYNYLFLNFSGEELGLLGSKNFVKDQQDIDSAHIAYMVNLDMVGRLNDSTHALTIGGVGTSPSWAQWTKPNKKFKWVIDSSGIGPSDHTSFYHQGIPVLFFFTGIHKDYHKPTDVASGINYKGEVMVVKYVEEVITKMDRQPKPKFTPTKQNTVGKVNFKVTLGIMPDYSFTGEGVRVDGVSENRPAILAGVKEGDIITALGQYKVNGMQSYMEALSKFAPGDKTNVTVLRKEQEMVLPITLSK